MANTQSTSLELIQCLAFAYFAKTKNQSKDITHEENWYDIFNFLTLTTDVTVNVGGRKKTFEKGKFLTRSLKNKLPKDITQSYKRLMKEIPSKINAINRIKKLNVGAKKIRSGGGEENDLREVKNILKRKEDELRWMGEGEDKSIIVEDINDIIEDITKRTDVLKRIGKILEKLHEIKNKDTYVEDSSSEENVSARMKEVEETYKRWLSNDFNYNKIFDRNSGIYTKMSADGKLLISPRLKKAYLTAKQLSSSSVHVGMDKYKFLDQTDPFVRLVKDRSLERIVSVFKLNLNADILSPVDIIMVKIGKEDVITKEFNKSIVECTDKLLLKRMTKGNITYRNIVSKRFKDKSMIGISVKFPQTNSVMMKIVGVIHVDEKIKNLVDPYTKLLAQIIDSGDMDKLIDKAITIKFDKFVINPIILSWAYPVMFNFSKIGAGSEFGNEAIHTMDLEFKLFTWSAQGFNGQWSNNAEATRLKLPQPMPSNWTGGAGIKTVEYLFHRYNEYEKILAEMIRIRKDAFMDALGKNYIIPNELVGMYHKAWNDIGKRHILTKASYGDVKKFMDATKVPRLFNDFMAKTITYLLSDLKISDQKWTKEMLPERLVPHFISVQLAWFLYRHGKTYSGMYASLKKRMFLSIFGMITKGGYIIFQKTGETVTAESLYRHAYKKKKMELVAHFQQAPYILTS